MHRHVAALLAGLPLVAGLAGLAHAQETAEASVVDNKGASIGTIQLRGSQAGVVIRVSLKAGALQPGWHGAHMHAVGDCSDTDKFMASKAHVNHDNRKHGLLNAEGPDNGDLPNLYAAADGSVNAELFTPFVKLSGANGLKDADGSAFVIHASEDDHAAQPIGNAGARVACAAIK
ncbi:superoxide dismutase family protein [Alsobacter soli]|uniref:Superoxide dismutase [Cu-Zn] n=1 Tax=Alsobacter soli TaxID=2109933 RepID=A0A2T1HNF0_9HYPH|nr:superoxide dismutase family protein [Alsobacter soli]PSC03153.1 superoxide dismutase family protein [Alsobacter soli]